MAQPIERRIQCFVFFGEVQADDVVDRLAEEGASRYRTDADLACELLAEVNIALPLFEVRRNIGPVSYTHLDVYKRQRPDDAADALAIAICHARSATSLLSRVSGGDVKQTI